jgi:hypothetical protein
MLSAAGSRWMGRSERVHDLDQIRQGHITHTTSDNAASKPEVGLIGTRNEATALTAPIGWA